MTYRQTSQIVRGQPAVDGAGVRLQRVLGPRNVKAFDPFLMLDGFDSQDPNDYIKGFPWHPHRGIETVTYLVSGSMEHGDSLGNRGTIRDGSCQWMTAGSGIIHQEMPQASERMLGCQLWVNLAADDKMTVPSYHDIEAKDLVPFEDGEATVRLLSGRYRGHEGAYAPEYVQVTYMDVDLPANAEWVNDEVPGDETAFIYLFDGQLAPEGRDFEARRCAILFDRPEDESQAAAIRVRAGDEGARFVLIHARPLNEPVAWGGPIVMNTQEELATARAELADGSFIRHGAMPDEG